MRFEEALAEMRAGKRVTLNKYDSFFIENNLLMCDLSLMPVNEAFDEIKAEHIMSEDWEIVNE